MIKGVSKKSIWLISVLLAVSFILVSCSETQNQKSKRIEAEFSNAYQEGIMGFLFSQWRSGEGYRVSVFLEEPFSVDTFWQACEKFTEMLQVEKNNGFKIMYLEIILTEENERVLVWNTENSNLYTGTLENLVSSNIYNTSIPEIRDITESMDNTSFDSALKDIKDALSFNLGVVDGKYNRPSGLLDMVDADSSEVYYFLVGRLTSEQIVARLDRTQTQNYRTLYYALHWRNAYIEEFGEDSYMKDAERFIANILSQSDIQKLNSFFDDIE